MVVELDEICGDITEEEDQPAGNPAADLKPEYCQYKDEGCKYAASCLACPFSDCIYDNPRSRRRWLKEQRNKDINRLFQSGRNEKELAKLFGVSRRTIQRALKEKENKLNPSLTLPLQTSPSVSLSAGREGGAESVEGSKDSISWGEDD